MSLRDLITDYQAKTPRSRALFEEAQRVLPGGNTRTTIFLLNEGILLSQRGMGAVSTAMRDSEIERFGDVLGKVLDAEARW